MNKKSVGLDLIEQLVASHLAAIEAIRVISHADAMVDQLAVALHEFHRFELGKGENVRTRVQRTIKQARVEENADFFYLRRALLISICSAFELTVRQEVVDCLLETPDHCERFWGKLRNSARDVVSLGDEVKLADFVDSNLREVPKEISSNGMAAIYRLWLSVVEQDPPDDIKMDEEINDVLSARNHAVHESEKSRKKLRVGTSAFVSNDGQFVIDAKGINIAVLRIKEFVGGIGCKNL